MMIKVINMKRILMAMILATIIVSCVYADSQSIELNGASFEIPSKYQGGKLTDNRYSLDNNFSIMY